MMYCFYEFNESVLVYDPLACSSAVSGYQHSKYCIAKQNVWEGGGGGGANKVG